MNVPTVWRQMTEMKKEEIQKYLWTVNKFGCVFDERVQHEIEQMFALKPCESCEILMYYMAASRNRIVLENRTGLEKQNYTSEQNSSNTKLSPTSTSPVVPQTEDSDSKSKATDSESNTPKTCSSSNGEYKSQEADSNYT